MQENLPFKSSEGGGGGRRDAKQPWIWIAGQYLFFLFFNQLDLDKLVI